MLVTTPPKSAVGFTMGIVLVVLLSLARPSQGYDGQESLFHSRNLQQQVTPGIIANGVTATFLKVVTGEPILNNQVPKQKYGVATAVAERMDISDTTKSVKLASKSTAQANYEFYFPTLTAVSGGYTISITAQLGVGATAANWRVDMFDFLGAKTWVQVRDLTGVRSGEWTTISMSISTVKPNNFISTVKPNEHLVRLYTRGASGAEAVYIDQIVLASLGTNSPAPSPVSAPSAPVTSPVVTAPVSAPSAPVTSPVVAAPVSAPSAPVTSPVVAAPVSAPSAPVTSPVVTAPVSAPSAPMTSPVVAAPVSAPSAPVTSPVVAAPVSTPSAPVMSPVKAPAMERWNAFAQFVPDWVAWKNKLGNRICDRMEECRTDPACCDWASETCGNGICEPRETRASCGIDCTHELSVCGNGVCESSAGANPYHVKKYENQYSCPVDCLTSPNLDVSSTTGSCFMRGEVCAPICGDGICVGVETCTTCSRDCGYCEPQTGDGVCSYPLESLASPDCAGGGVLNFITVDGEQYATIDDTNARDGTYTINSCSKTPKVVPAGWRLADWDPDVAKKIATWDGGDGANFDTWCLVFSNGQGVDSSTGLSCGNYTTAIAKNGLKVSIPSDYCAARLMIQRMKEPAAEKKKICPTCLNGGACDAFTGLCMCRGAWTGRGCERAIGDYSVPPAANYWYKPGLGVTWEWRLSGAIDPTNVYDVDIYDIDYDNTATTIEILKGKGKKVMCYISAGSYENFRIDEAMFPAEVKGPIVSFGEGDTFPDENWLDLRRLDLVAPIMLDRLDVMAAKGCDLVEWDNADLPDHDTQMPISLSLQIAYNAWIAAQTHARGMGVAMKNNNVAASFHVHDYDLVVNEECWINGNCQNYWPWLKAGKPVLNTEYFTARCMYCERANKMGIATIKKVPELTDCRVDCKTLTAINNQPCIDASVSGFAYPINWKFGAGAMMSTNWCPMTRNILQDECPVARFATCDPQVGY